jgi:hypothetical protein
MVCVYFGGVCLTVFTLNRMDNLIMEAISSLNQVGGSNETRIANFIEVLFRFLSPSFIFSAFNSFNSVVGML